MYVLLNENCLVDFELVEFSDIGHLKWFMETSSIVKVCKAIYFI